MLGNTMLRLGLFFVFLAAVSAGKHDIYIGHTIHGVKIRDLSDLRMVQDLETSLDVDIFQYGYPAERDAVIRLTPDNRNFVLNRLDEFGIQHFVQTEDVAQMLEAQDQLLREWEVTRSRSNRAAVPFDHYPRHAEINEYMDRLGAEYPDIVTVVNAGPSFEGRDIKYVKISTTNFTDSSKPIYFMEAMLHAREWVTTPVTLFSMYRLVENLRTQDQDLLNEVDWIILPLVNPDGYEFTHESTRLWRRTRSFRPENHATCYGVDGNRNFDVAWNTTIGVSSNPCSDIYTGPEPFSEPETRVVRDILHEHIDRIQIYMDIHSHGNWVLFGYGDGVLPPYPANPVNIFHVAAAMGATMDALKLPQADYYTVVNSAELYPTSGSADDYALQVGVPLPYCLELPGYGYAFQVPPTYIEHINYETWEGIAVSARLARSHYRARLNSNV